MKNLLHGDMGRSYTTHREVAKTLMDAFPNTVKLSFWAVLISIVIALPIGIISAIKQYSALDYIGMV